MKTTFAIAVIVVSVIAFMFMIALVIARRPRLPQAVEPTESYYPQKVLLLLHEEKEHADKQKVILQKYKSNEAFVKDLLVIVVVSNNKYEEFVSIEPGSDAIARAEEALKFSFKNYVSSSIFNVLDLRKLVFFILANPNKRFDVCSNNKALKHMQINWHVNEAQRCIDEQHVIDLPSPKKLRLSHFVFRMASLEMFNYSSKIEAGCNVIVAITQSVDDNQLTKLRNLIWLHGAKPIFIATGLDKHAICGSKSFGVKEVNFYHYSCQTHSAKSVSHAFLNFIVTYYANVPEYLIFWEYSKNLSSLQKILQTPLARSISSKNDLVRMGGNEFGLWYERHIGKWSEDNSKPVFDNFLVRTSRSKLRPLEFYKSLLHNYVSTDKQDEWDDYLKMAFGSIMVL